MTALYELELLSGAAGALGTVNLRWMDPDSHEAREASATIDVRVVDRSYATASPRFRLAALVAAWAGALRHDPWAASVSLDAIAESAAGLARELQDDQAVAEFAQLAGETARMWGR